MKIKIALKFNKKTNTFDIDYPTPKNDKEACKIFDRCIHYISQIYNVNEDEITIIKVTAPTVFESVKNKVQRYVIDANDHFSIRIYLTRSCIERIYNSYIYPQKNLIILPTMTSIDKYLLGITYKPDTSIIFLQTSCRKATEIFHETYNRVKIYAEAFGAKVETVTFSCVNDNDLKKKNYILGTRDSFYKFLNMEEMSKIFEETYILTFVELCKNLEGKIIILIPLSVVDNFFIPAAVIAKFLLPNKVDLLIFNTQSDDSITDKNDKSLHEDKYEPNIVLQEIFLPNLIYPLEPQTNELLHQIVKNKFINAKDLSNLLSVDKEEIRTINEDLLYQFFIRTLGSESFHVATPSGKAFSIATYDDNPYFSFDDTDITFYINDIEE